MEQCCVANQCMSRTDRNPDSMLSKQAGKNDHSPTSSNALPSPFPTSKMSPRQGCCRVKVEKHTNTQRACGQRIKALLTINHLLGIFLF